MSQSTFPVVRSVLPETERATDPSRPENTNQSPPRKRRRPALACFECRRRKVKCDRSVPCSPCTQAKCSCVYNSNAAATAQARQYNVEASNSYRSVPSEHFRPAESGHLPLDRFPTPVSSPGSFSAGGISQLVEASRYGIPPTSENTVEELLHRIQTLERKLSDSQRPANRSDAAENEANSSTPTMRASLSKTRMFGPSHWMGHWSVFQKSSPFKFWNIDTATFVLNPQFKEITTLLDKCKKIGKHIKTSRPSRWTIPPDQNFKTLIPPRSTADALVSAYFRCFESTFRILHIPSFRAEYVSYWKDPEGASMGFVIKLLAVMAIGASVYVNGEGLEGKVQGLENVLRWMYAGMNWLSVPFEKSRLNLTGLQIYCLILVARQCVYVGQELVWISAGSLVRTAMQMGLHRDPRHFDKMSSLHAEIRRRLWATILELSVQSSLDSGMPPMISFSDFDTSPPSNINDDDIDETTLLPPISKPNNVFTQTSLQIILFKSLRTRLEVARTVNYFHSDPSYDKVLKLGSEVLKACRNSSDLFMSAAQQPLAPTTFHRNITDYYLRRCLLTLHHPFAFKSREDPRFYFSRKICLDSALVLASPEPDIDYQNFLAIGGGLFRAISTHCAITLWFEVITQQEEDSSSGIRNRSRKNSNTTPILKAASNLIFLLEKRMQNGETNAKGVMFINMVIAQIEAIEAGTSQDQAIIEAATKVARFCYHTMRSKLESPLLEDLLLENEREQQGGMEAAVAVDGEVSDLGFGLLPPDGNLDFEFPDSWLFSQGFDENYWNI